MLLGFAEAARFEGIHSEHEVGQMIGRIGRDGAGRVAHGFGPTAAHDLGNEGLFQQFGVGRIAFQRGFEEDVGGFGVAQILGQAGGEIGAQNRVGVAHHFGSGGDCGCQQRGQRDGEQHPLGEVLCHISDLFCFGCVCKAWSVTGGAQVLTKWCQNVISGNSVHLFVTIYHARTTRVRWPAGLCHLR